MTKKVRTYSDEFKAEAVKKIADNNGNISATAKQLGIAMQTLSNWHNKAKAFYAMYRKTGTVTVGAADFYLCFHNLKYIILLGLSSSFYFLSILSNTPPIYFDRSTPCGSFLIV